MSNGEKVPPSDIEAAILRDPLFDQVMLLGEQKPYLTVIAVVNPEQWQRLSSEQPGLTLESKAAHDLAVERIGRQLREFPGYAQVRSVVLTGEPWSIENGLLTPTLKLKRAKVMDKFAAEIDAMYEGHL